MAVSQITPNLGLTLPGTSRPDMGNASDDLALIVAALLAIDGLSALLADTGSANAYAVALSPAVALFTGMELNFKAAHANTGASTLAVNGGDAIAIKKAGTTALASADIGAGVIVKVVYDGTNFQLVSI